MGIETAFLIGVLVGHWIMLWMLFAALLKLLRLLKHLEANANAQPSQNQQIANFLPPGLGNEDTPYNDD
jgi:hypothetical protein